MANILIIGASKGIGLESTKQALSKGHRVRALSRSTEHIAIDNPNLEKRNGDALDEKTVASSLENIDAVIQSLGVSFGREFLLGPIGLFSDATRILVSAMEAADVRRLICVTGFGAGDSCDRMSFVQSIPFHLILGRVYDDKGAQELIIKRSKLDWTIVRPGILTNGPRTGRYAVLADATTWRNGIISRADVADFLIHQIEDDTYLRQTPVLVS